MLITDWLNDILLFFQRGGGVIYAILFTSVLMWFFILQRYWFLLFESEAKRMHILEQYRNKVWAEDAPLEYIRYRITHRFKTLVERHLKLIGVFVDVLPLLGLLGTITGMIKVFDVITVFGVGNARGMAGGISEALITTMAGLITALSGLYFRANLKSISDRKSHAFETQLKNMKLKTSNTSDSQSAALHPGSEGDK